ncbi:E3 ubiquitin-protein ligase RNF26 [Camelus dromedarius]|uniref:E3 ubiquitin-protein ligase RNF26 n=1 Tax=Camelus dromedarius TaxID=9838 RepID=A0A5N4EGB0_CAMDR|nr:E3 ubiquitin-protein ligase RNF26 [Camelus dromedarius]
MVKLSMEATCMTCGFRTASTIVEAVCLAVDGVGLLLDVLTVVLDLSFLLVSSLLASLAWLLAFICNLPHTVLTGLPHLRRGAWLSLLALIEAEPETLHRGILNVVSNGHALLRQACGICAITMSLVACVINSLVNICLIGTQNLFSLVLAL